MTVPSGTFQSFQAVGNREDLEDIIWDVSPLETPFTTQVKKGKAKATYHEWQTDALAAAATNAQVQGDDATVNTAAPTVRLRNYCQILSKTVSVSGTQDAVDKAGRDSEISYQTAKRMKELRRDLEYACVRNQASTAGAANKTSAGQTSGTTIATTQGYSGGTVAAPTDASTTGTVTEAHLKKVISQVWTAGGNPELLMVGPATKQKVSSGFSGIATRFKDVAGTKQAQIVSGVDLYVSDFGTHKLVPNRFMRDQNILALDMEYWSLDRLRTLQSWELAKTGDSEKRQMLMEVTLSSKNELASGKVSDINPAL
jgi:hypothetical protein